MSVNATSNTIPEFSITFEEINILWNKKKILTIYHSTVVETNNIYLLALLSCFISKKWNHVTRWSVSPEFTAPKNKNIKSNIYIKVIVECFQLLYLPKLLSKMLYNFPNNLFEDCFRELLFLLGCPSRILPKNSPDIHAFQKFYILQKALAILLGFLTDSSKDFAIYSLTSQTNSSKILLGSRNLPTLHFWFKNNSRNTFFRDFVANYSTNYSILISNLYWISWVNGFIRYLRYLFLCIFLNSYN